MRQKNLILSKDWDCLIILDACRYDFFRDLYKKFTFKGSLQKVYSEGSCTLEWLKKTFNKNLPVVYVSANPYVNSCAEVQDFSGSHHFDKVVDVWNWGWDEKLNTVPPSTVRNATIKAERNYPKKKLIIHFLQPHYPFISIGGGLSDKLPFDGVRKSQNSFESIIKKFQIKVESLMGKDTLWKIKDYLDFPPVSEYEAVVRKYGKKGLRKAYRENLKLGLKEIEKIVDKLSKNTVISADHGELIGENGCYGHHCGSGKPILREIPWFRLKKS